MANGTHAQPVQPPTAALVPLSPTFERVRVPLTGREAVLITANGSASYPFYYFAPSITKDGRYVVYHRYGRNDTAPPPPPSRR